MTGRELTIGGSMGGRMGGRRSRALFARGPLGAVLSAVLLLASGCRSTRPQGPPPAAAERGSSLLLDGTSGYATAAFAEADPFVQEATLSARVYFEVLPSKARRIFSIVGKSGVSRDLDVQAEPDDRFHFYVGPGAPNVAVSTTRIQTGVWYRVDAAYRAEKSVDIYVNGALEGTTPIRITRAPNTGPIVVGANVVFPNRFFQGRIDDVAVFERALPADEIARPHPLKGDEPGLVVAYGFEGDLRDLKGKHDGQLVGAAKVAPPGAPAE
jgi:hypothetical protein